MNLWTVGCADPRLTASAVPYGQAGENAMRFPHLAHRSAAAHKLHSATATISYELDSGKGEPIIRLPALAYSPGSCPNDRDRRSSGVSCGRCATHTEGGVCDWLQPVEHLPAAASDKVELVGAAPAPPAGRCDGAGGVFATVGLQLERVQAMQAPVARVEVCFQDEVHWPEEQLDPGMGANRQPAGGAKRSRLRLGLRVWCGLPVGGQGGGAVHADLQYRGDEPSPTRDQQPSRR